MSPFSGGSVAFRAISALATIEITSGRVPSSVIQPMTEIVPTMITSDPIGMRRSQFRAHLRSDRQSLLAGLSPWRPKPQNTPLDRVLAGAPYLDVVLLVTESLSALPEEISTLGLHDRMVGPQCLGALERASQAIHEPRTARR